MKKKMICILLASLWVMAANAQKETKKFSMGFGLEAGVPSGNLGNLYTTAIGLTIRASWHAGPGFATLTSGLLGYVPKKIIGVPSKAGLQIPVRAGYKYIIQHHLFLMGEVGYSDFNTYYGYKGSLVSTSSGALLVAPSIGFQANAFELGIRYDMFTNSTGSVAAVRLGFNF
ncbi:MAG TPA: hypothetical protein VKQ52_20790 [Puia sp.]|nr:hypothetical protein [Puia sp.]